jgi:hypothetical protein
MPQAFSHRAANRRPVGISTGADSLSEKSTKVLFRIARDAFGTLTDLAGVDTRGALPDATRYGVPDVAPAFRLLGADNARDIPANLLLDLTPDVDPLADARRAVWGGHALVVTPIFCAIGWGITLHCSDLHLL